MSMGSKDYNHAMRGVIQRHYMLKVAIAANRKIGMKKKTVIMNEKKHQYWTDRWLKARWSWWAKYCKAKMDSCVTTDYEYYLTNERIH